MFRIGAWRGNRDLVGAIRALDGLPIYNFGAGPTFRSAKNDHGPDRPAREAFRASRILNAPNLLHHGFKRPGHQLMHGFRLVTFDPIGLVAHPSKKLTELVVADASEYGGIVDLVAVEMENRQHRPVADRIEKLVGMPACSKRLRLGFSIAHDAAEQQIGIIKRRAVRMGNGVAQLAAFVDWARSLRSHMA